MSDIPFGPISTEGAAYLPEGYSLTAYPPYYTTATHRIVTDQDIQIQGNKVFFRTENGKTLLKDKKGDIDINIGEGEIRPRPVVELDFRIGKKEFKGIPFSIADRSTNLYKILVGKDFIENHLDALIDVSQENIADEDIDCEY